MDCNTLHHGGRWIGQVRTITAILLVGSFLHGCTQGVDERRPKESPLPGIPSKRYSLLNIADTLRAIEYIGFQGYDDCGYALGLDSSKATTILGIDRIHDLLRISPIDFCEVGMHRRMTADSATIISKYSTAYMIRIVGLRSDGRYQIPIVMFVNHNHGVLYYCNSDSSNVQYVDIDPSIIGEMDSIWMSHPHSYCDGSTHPLYDGVIISKISNGVGSAFIIQGLGDYFMLDAAMVQLSDPEFKFRSRCDRLIWKVAQYAKVSIPQAIAEAIR